MGSGAGAAGRSARARLHAAALITRLLTKIEFKVSRLHLNLLRISFSFICILFNLKLDASSAALGIVCLHSLPLFNVTSYFNRKSHLNNTTSRLIILDYLAKKGPSI